MTTSPNNRELAEAAISGDQQAIAALVTRFEPMARRIAARLPDHDDAVQLCRIALWRVLPVWQRRGYAGDLAPFAATVFRAVVRDINKHNNASKRHGPIADIDEAAIVPAPEPGPLAVLIPREELDRLLAICSTRARQIVQMIGAGYTPAQIDSEMGLRAGAAREYLHKIRKAAGVKLSARVVEQLSNCAGIVTGRFINIKAAAEATGICAQNIGQAIAGKIPSAGGYRWRYGRAA